MNLRTLALASSLALSPFAAFADWTADPSHSSITFDVNHLGFSVIPGKFETFETDITFDPENIEATVVSVTIDAASVDTGWEARDAHLNRADFLNTAEYPQITFTSTSVEKTGDNTAVVNGDLSMLGQTLPASFNAVLNNLGPNPFNPSQQIAGFTITGDIDRAAYGMGFGVPAISGVIPVTINIELTQ